MDRTVQGVKIERKIIHVTDGVKSKAFNAANSMPVSINNPNEDDALNRIFKHSDQVHDDEEQRVHLTEVLKKGDSRIQSEKAKAAVQKELDGLYKEGVLKKNVP